MGEVIWFSNIGDMTWSGGRHYSGSFKDGARDGFGEFYWPHVKYTGMYRDNRKHDKGMYSYSDGSILNCVYFDNVLVGSPLTQERQVQLRQQRRQALLYIRGGAGQNKTKDAEADIHIEFVSSRHLEHTQPADARRDVRPHREYLE